MFCFRQQGAVWRFTGRPDRLYDGTGCFTLSLFLLSETKETDVKYPVSNYFFCLTGWWNNKLSYLTVCRYFNMSLNVWTRRKDVTVVKYKCIGKANVVACLAVSCSMLCVTLRAPLCLYQSHVHLGLEFMILFKNV